MPSLGDAYDGAEDEWERRRLYFGAALLFVGAAVAAPGLARVTAGALQAVGVASSPALALGVATAALAVPLVGAALHRWLPSSQRFRAAAAAGVLLSTVAVAAFLLAVPPAQLTGPGAVPAAILVTYVAGALLALWSPIVAAGLAASDDGRDHAVSSSAFVRSSSPARPGGHVPADGGQEEQQLAFLLDNDDK